MAKKNKMKIRRKSNHQRQEQPRTTIHSLPFTEHKRKHETMRMLRPQQIKMIFIDSEICYVRLMRHGSNDNNNDVLLAGKTAFHCFIFHYIFSYDVHDCVAMMTDFSKYRSQNRTTNNNNPFHSIGCNVISRIF